jgi:hypothetical protein
MTKRREFIQKGLMGAAGVAIGGIGLNTGSFASVLENSSRILAGKVLKPIVEVEEEVYRYEPADNGAGPMWCAGSTSLVRIGKKVFASGLETISGQKPLNNCRWMLFERSRNGWKQILVDTEGRTREPSPLATFHDGSLLLSANPTLTEPDTYNGPARPEILLFNTADSQLKYERLIPGWAGTPPFTEHSYRSLAADGAAKEMILFQNIEYTHAEWAFRDSSGKWSAQGQLKWPWGADYEVPEPIRVCYPNVMLKDRSVYFCGVSDVIEPKKAWREYKRQITGKEWDYDFRRLFFTWSDDITKGDFHPWIEIASREETCGWIFPADLWVGPDGAVHIMWTERAIDERLREKFFPEAKQSNALNYAIVRNGKVESRRTLFMGEEGGSNDIPGMARFQVTPDNRIFVVYFIKGTNAAGQPFAENRVMELSPEGIPGSPVALPLKQAFSSFFTATVRAGSSPSVLLDMLGTPNDGKNTIHYARVRL